MVVEIKAGIKTTEFWVTLFSIVVVASAALAGIELNVETIAGLITPAVAYTIARGKAKSPAKP